MRRFFRILPPALLYLGVVGLLGQWRVIAVNVHELVGAAFFFRNYSSLMGGVQYAGWYTTHFWSLSLEEQFYLILPFLLVLTAKRYRVAALSMCAVAVAGHRFWVLQTHSWWTQLFHADVRMDALLVPALLAVLCFHSGHRRTFERLLRPWPMLALVSCVLVSVGRGRAWQISALIVLMPCVILGSALHAQGVFGRALEWGPLRFVGRISYSLYLWQQLFFTGHFVSGRALGLLQQFPLNLLLTFGCALGSYYLVERPFMRLAQRLAASATPGRETAG